MSYPEHVRTEEEKGERAAFIAFCIVLAIIALFSLIFTFRPRENRVPYACTSWTTSETEHCKRVENGLNVVPPKCWTETKETCLNWKKCEGDMDCYGEEYEP